MLSSCFSLHLFITCFVKHTTAAHASAVQTDPARLHLPAQGQNRKSGCAAQKQAAQQHVGVPLWCPKPPSGSRRALLQQQPSGAGTPQNAVVDMTNSAIEATMMAPPSSSGQAHIEDGDGAAATYVPDTPARRLQAAQGPPTVVDMTHSELEATMMGGQPPGSSGRVATIEQGDGTTVTYVPGSNGL